MTLPDSDEPALYREEPHWGVSRDPDPPQRSPFSRIIWIILTILIILAMVLPWILPYFYPRRFREGLQANLTTETTERTEILINLSP